MIFCMAPMEGITGHVFRRTFAEVFGPADRHIIPFLTPTHSHNFRKREWQEVRPGFDPSLPAVPQLLCRDPEDFLWAVEEMAALGYPEVNLNLGCPSGTVVPKGKGAGFLAYPEELDAFLDQVCARSPLPVSVKTRLGLTDPAEFRKLLAVFNRHPLAELTVHARVRADYYRGEPDWETFRLALAGSRAPVCYNGDLFTKADYERFRRTFPEAERIMIGRGIAANPGLLREIRGGEPMTKGELAHFLERLFANYQAAFGPDGNPVPRMKELWSYLRFSFSDPEACRRKIRKAVRREEYQAAVRQIFAEQELVPGARFCPELL